MRLKFFPILTYLILLSFLLFTIVPFLWLLLSAFRPNMDLLSKPFDIPTTLNLDNFTEVFKTTPILQYFFNTIIVVAITTIMVIIVATMGSYAFMYRFKIKPTTVLFVTFGLFIPINAFLVPYYLIINKIGLYDTLLGIALVYAGTSLPMSILIIKGYMESIPKEILESTQIDGASSLTTLWKIITPISVPGIVTSCVFLVIHSWNELMYANLLNQNDGSRTLQVAIKFFLTTFEANYAHAFAAMVITIIPTVLIYVFLTDKIIGGMTAGAVKG